MDDFQFQQQKIEKEIAKQKTETEHCDKCGASLSSGDKFCPECGEEIGGLTKTCRWCGKITTKEICPECGKRIVPRICTKCGKEAFFDVCENCGEILSTELQATINAEKTSVKEISEKEADEILKDFAETETSELKHFRDKIKEHETLLAEKEYFDEREKRIKNTFGENFSAIKYPDIKETQFLQEVSEGIKKSALRKVQESIQNSLEKKFDGIKSEEDEHAELLLLIKQREELFAKDIAENREKIDALQREIEERRKREEEIAREKRRLEIEAFNNRICGTYVSAGSTSEIKLMISLDSNRNIYGKDLTTYSYDYFDAKYRGVVYVAEFQIHNFNGTTFDFTETGCRYIRNPQNLPLSALLTKFYGNLNYDGTVINGHWIDSGNTRAYSDYRKY